MARGRPPKPAEDRLLGKSASAAARIETKQPLNAALKPSGYTTRDMVPKHLTAAQQELWDEYFPENYLLKHERIPYLDWIVAVDDGWRAQDECTKRGDWVELEGETVTVVKPNGNTVTKHKPTRVVYAPWAVARDKAFMRKRKAEQELGFSPTSRARAPKGSGRAAAPGGNGAAQGQQGESSSRFGSAPVPGSVKRH